METNNKKKQGFKGIEAAGLVIIACFVVALCIYKFVLGDPSNFMNNDPNNHPLPGNMLGTIYKGGVVVPIIQTLLLTVIALSVERYFTIRAAFGRGKLVKFVAQIKEALAKNDMQAAQALCDKQRGSVANVVGATLQTYREMGIGYPEVIGRSYCIGNADVAAELADHWYYYYTGYSLRFAWYRYRYDSFIRRFVCWWWY